MKLYCVLQDFPCVTQPHAMALMSASGPNDAWEQVQGFHPSYPSPTHTDPVEATFAGLLLSWGLQHIWLAGYALTDGKVIILVGFPLSLMYNCCQALAVDANQHTDERLHSFPQISMSCTGIPNYTVRVLDRNPSEKFAELIRYLCLTSMILHQSQWDTACLATEGTWQWGFCM